MVEKVWCLTSHFRSHLEGIRGTNYAHCICWAWSFFTYSIIVQFALDACNVWWKKCDFHHLIFAHIWKVFDVQISPSWGRAESREIWPSGGGTPREPNPPIFFPRASLMSVEYMAKKICFYAPESIIRDEKPKSHLEYFYAPCKMIKKLRIYLLSYLLQKISFLFSH